MKIYYTPKAQEDLMCIKERVIETWANEELAVKVIKRITGAVKRLVAFPYIGKEQKSHGNAHSGQNILVQKCRRHGKHRQHADVWKGVKIS